MCLEVRPPEILGLLLEHLVCGEPWARRRMPQQNQDWRPVSPNGSESLNCLF